MAENSITLAQRMLRRLPPSLWDQGLETTQGKLYASVADMLSQWMEEQEVVRKCTLLQEAEGLDLDILLHDYTLRRYNQRADKFARQIARQILWTPKGTLYALQEILRLLTDAPQMLGRSGRLQPHGWVALANPVTFARTYWQLGDALGRIWYLSIAANTVNISLAPPPGASITPWPDGYTPIPSGGPSAFAGGWEDVATLMWFRALDGVATPWYVSIDGGSLSIGTTHPSGPGTTQPLQLLDGEGQAWTVVVNADDGSAIVSSLTTPSTAPTYWMVKDSSAVPWVVYIDSGALSARTPPGLLGWADTTPGGVPVDFVRIVTSVTRYLVLDALGTINLSDTLPGGSGATANMDLFDAATEEFWRVTLDSSGNAFALSPLTPPAGLSGDPLMVLNPEYCAEYVALNDESAQTWYLYQEQGNILISKNIPAGYMSATPAGGPFTWWRLPMRNGTSAAVRINGVESCLVVSATPPSGNGFALPRTLGDIHESLWHWGVSMDFSLSISNSPSVDFGQAPTCLVMNDAFNGRWFWRPDMQERSVLVSRVQEEETIPWQSLGEITWLRAPDLGGGQPWYIAPTTSYDIIAGHAPPLGCSWGIEANMAPLYDREGHAWRFGVNVAGEVTIERLPDEEITPATPIFYARDAIDALHHVQAAGNITTLWVA